MIWIEHKLEGLKQYIIRPNEDESCKILVVKQERGTSRTTIENHMPVIVHEGNKEVWDAMDAPEKNVVKVKGTSRDCIATVAAYIGKDSEYGIHGNMEGRMQWHK